jgi:hypothetical protein
LILAGSRALLLAQVGQRALHANLKKVHHLPTQHVWLNQNQMSSLFDTSIDNVGLHLSIAMGDQPA